MLKLRLRRIGRKHDPSFRVVVTEATTPPKGKYLESVGFYNARLKQISLDKDRIKHWLSVGVQPTDTVHNLLIKEGIIEGKKIAVHSRKPSKKKAAEAKEKEASAPKAEEVEAKSETTSDVEEAPQEDAKTEEKEVNEEEVPAKEEAPAPEAEEAKKEEESQNETTPDAEKSEEGIDKNEEKE